MLRIQGQKVGFVKEAPLDQLATIFPIIPRDLENVVLSIDPEQISCAPIKGQGGYLTYTRVV